MFRPLFRTIVRPAPPGARIATWLSALPVLTALALSAHHRTYGDLVLASSSSPTEVGAPFVERNRLSLRVLFASMQLIREETQLPIDASDSLLDIPLATHHVVGASGSPVGSDEQDLLLLPLPPPGPTDPVSVTDSVATDIPGSGASGAGRGDSSLARHVASRRTLLASRLGDVTALRAPTIRKSKRVTLASVAAIPEPSAFCLVGAVLAGIVLGRRSTRCPR